MTCPHAHQDCHDCPFKQDPHDPLRWVCIKCKTEYSFHRFEFGFFSQFVVTLIISLLVLVWLSDRPLPEQPQDPFLQDSPTRAA